MILARSQRINIMKEAAARLGAEDYSLIDATLKQFALPVSHEWSGTKVAYVLRMLEDTDSLIDQCVFAQAGPFEMYREYPPVELSGPFRAAHHAGLRDKAEDCYIAHSHTEERHHPM